MGLDMYLKGRTYNWFLNEPEKCPKRDGFEIEGVVLRLGYWRKHPNLHGYIVQTFADGVDECQDIELTDGDIKQIIEAIKEKNLPHTTGFFFGTSDGSEDDESIKIFEAALKWVTSENFPESNETRTVYYRASW